MDQQIRRERHHVLFDLLNQVPEPDKLANGPVGSVLIVIDVPFAVLDV
jgi:hypothetical protein